MRGRPPRNAPPVHHVWKPVEAGLWRCRFCDGWVAAKIEPHHEAVALSEEAARARKDTPRMSTDTDTASACSHCGFQLPKHGGGLRHYGTHTAHQESECLNLLRAHIHSLAAERDALARRVADLEANGIHSCHPECERPVCVLVRERDALLAKVAEQEATLALQKASYERELALDGGERDRLRAALEAEQADAENWGEALNKASWAVIDAYRKHTGMVEPPIFFNHAKPILRDGIVAYLAAIRATTPKDPT